MDWVVLVAIFVGLGVYLGIKEIGMTLRDACWMEDEDEES